MELYTYENKKATSRAAAEKAAVILNKAISEKGKATFVIATGNSQLEFIEALTEADVDWRKTEMFHLDEYIGISEQHPASFRKYLQEKFLSRVGKLGQVHFIKGDAENLEAEIEHLNSILEEEIVDVSFVGIGENGHLAFNDPPADFTTEEPYIIVEMDKKCQQQQVGEGWFETINDVPRKAISMSINQIIKSQNIICTVPGKRKARAVKNCLGTESVSPDHPASILKRHDKAYIYLDRDSASLL